MHLGQASCYGGQEFTRPARVPLLSSRDKSVFARCYLAQELLFSRSREGLVGPSQGGVPGSDGYSAVNCSGVMTYLSFRMRSEITMRLVTILETSHQS